jgi:hypothetical protein
MRRKTLRDLEYLKQNYKPSEVQKLLNSSKIKREVYQELKVSEYVLNNYELIAGLNFYEIKPL